MSEAQARELWAQWGLLGNATTPRPRAPDETRQRQPRSSPDSLLFGSDPDAKLVFSCHNAVTIGTLYLQARISPTRPLFDIVAARLASPEQTSRIARVNISTSGFSSGGAECRAGMVRQARARGPRTEGSYKSNCKQQGPA